MVLNYLITGGAGFIGSNIVKELIRRNENVRVIDNFSTGYRENIVPFFNKIELIEGDIRSYHIVNNAVKDVDVILHQAALPSVPRSIKDPLTTNEVNVVGTLNILDAARENNIKKIVFASSSSIYGNNENLPLHEDMMPNPISPYAISKLAAEKYCQAYNNIYGLKTICLRYFNVFGPNQNPNSQYSAVIPKFIKAFIKNERPIIYGDGEQYRDFSYVSNIVEANLLAANSDFDSGIVLNCACGGRITLNQLVYELNDLFKKKIKPKYTEKRIGDIKYSYANIDKAKRILGYKPKVNFKEGLRKTLKKYE